MRRQAAGVLASALGGALLAFAGPVSARLPDNFVYALEIRRFPLPDVPAEAIPDLIELLDATTLDETALLAALVPLQTAMSRGRMDDASYERIAKWLDFDAGRGRWMAVKVLAETPADDPRIARSTALLITLLERERTRSVRRDAARALIRLVSKKPLSEADQARVLAVALSFWEGRTRFDAMDILLASGVNERLAHDLSLRLTAALSRPDKFPGQPAEERDYLVGRATELLERLTGQTGPPQLVGPLVAACATELSTCARVIPALTAAAARGELTPPDRDQIEWASIRLASSCRLHNCPDDQIRKLFELALGGSDPRGQLPIILENLLRATGDEQVRAVLQVRYIGEHFGLPRQAVEAAMQALKHPLPPQLQQIVHSTVAAYVLSATSQTDLFSHAANTSMPESLRVAALMAQGNLARQGEPLPADIERQLRDLASNGSSYELRQAAGHTLEDAGKWRPLGTVLEDRKLRANVLGRVLVAVFGVMVLAWLCVMIAGVGVLQHWTSRLAWSIWSVVMLAVFSVSMLGLLFSANETGALIWLVAFLANLAGQTAVLVRARRRRSDTSSPPRPSPAPAAHS